MDQANCITLHSGMPTKRIFHFYLRPDNGWDVYTAGIFFAAILSHKEARELAKLLSCGWYYYQEFCEKQADLLKSIRA